jgi:hypothetical protein
MTIAEGTPKQIYNGDDVNETFTFSHKVWTDDDLVVKHKTVGGAVTIPVLDTDYTVNATYPPTGQGVPTLSVTFPKGGSSYSTLATGEKLLIKRVRNKERTPDLRDAFQFNTLNLDGDDMVGMIQEVIETQSRGTYYDDFNTDPPPSLEDIEALIQNNQGSIGLLMDSGGAGLTSGLQSGMMKATYAGVIEEVTLYGGDTTGSTVVDIWKATHAGYKPTVGGTITASSKPTITTDDKYADTTLTGWTTAIAAGDTFFVNLDSVSGFEWLMIILKIRKTGA